MRSADAGMLKVSSVSKSFGATQALRDVDLEVGAGEIHALVGENGSGKSTLIKILAGFHTPDRGSVQVGGEELRLGSPEASYALGCRFVHQDLGLIDDLTVADNLCVGSGFPVRFGTIRTRELRTEATRMMAAVGLDLDPDTRVCDLSPAVRTGLALARALRSDQGHPARVLVLDEPTATMPDDEVTRLLDMVRHVADEGAAVLYVSHRLEEILQLCGQVTVLRDGERAALRPVAGLERRHLVELLVGSQPPGGGPYNETHVAHDDLDAPGPAEGGPSRTGLRVTGLRGQDIGGFDLEVACGSIVGIAGITGSGRERVLGAIFGAVPRTGGQVEAMGAAVRGGDPRAAISAGVSYLPPDRKSLGGLMDLTARENLTLLGLRDFWRRGWLRGREERDTARHWFDRLSIRPAGAIDLPLASFSGGNQQKVLLGKWLRVQPTVLLLDEPTQGVDIGAKAVLHEQILDRARNGAAVVVSSTDVEELVGLCDRVVVMADGRQTIELSGAELSADNLTRACLGSLQETST